MVTQPRRSPDGTGVPEDAPLQPVRRDGWAEEDFIDVEWYVRVIRRRWLVIAIGAAFCGVLAFWYASNRPLVYQGITTLLVVPPSQPTSTQINPATFRAIVENSTLASEVITELKLQDQLTAHTFVERALSVEEVRGTNIVKVKVTHSDPKVAADASRRVAQKAIVLTQQITQQEGSSIQGQLEKHLSSARERLGTAETELLTYKQSAQLELIKSDTDAQLKQRGDLLELLVAIEVERARLTAAETEIRDQQPLLSSPRLAGTEEAFRQVDLATKEAERRADTAAKSSSREKDRAKSATGEVDPRQLDLTNPYINPVYQTLRYQIATSRPRIAALSKERDELINVRKLGGKELAQLSELYRREIELARLQANFDLAKKVHSDLAVRYEESRTQPFGNIAQLQVVDAALPPERPVSRRRLQYATFGAGAGLVFTALLALAWEHRVRRP